MITPESEDRYLEIPGGYRAAPADASLIHDVPADEPIEISLYLRDVDLTEAMPKIAAFARAAGLSVREQVPTRRLIRLGGTAAQLEAAFRAKMHYYRDRTHSFRARTGALYAPAEIAGLIDAVLGFDTRQAAGPK